jgi:hypothetical protein
MFVADDMCCNNFDKTVSNLEGGRKEEERKEEERKEEEIYTSQLRFVRHN